MLSVIDELTLMGFHGFWLFPRNLICTKYWTPWVFMKKNATEKSSEICYLVHLVGVFTVS